MKPKVLHPPLADREFAELKVIAARKGITLGALTVLAFRTAPATRGAFKGEETDK